MGRSVGELLRRIREERGLALADLAPVLEVDETVLAALEDGSAAASMRAPVWRAHVRMYAQHLGLDAEALLRESDTPPAAERHAALAGGVAATDAVSSSRPSGTRGRDAGALATRHGRRRPAVRRLLLILTVLTLAAVALGTLQAWNGQTGVLLDGWAGTPDAAAPLPTPTPTAPSPAPHAATPTPLPAETPTTAPAPTPTPEVRAPEALRVQVLDGAQGRSRYEEAADALEALGYDVLRSGRAASAYEQTTVLFAEGFEAEAAWLLDTDPRFTRSRLNDRGLAADIDLHVVVGADWPEPADTEA